jgi:gluconolactonase
MMRSRREFIRSSLAGGVALALPGARQGRPAGGSGGAGIAHRYRDLRSDDYFEGSVHVEARLDDPDAFTEGPAVAGSGEVFFTNIPASKVLAWNPGKKKLRVVRENTGQANGLVFDSSGTLLACEGERGRVTRMDLRTGDITVLADQFGGRRLEAPNDLVLDRHGRVYFTSRPTASVPRKGNVNAVYRIDPGGALHQLLRDPVVHVPNGIALSPDEKTLYLIDADGGEARNRNLAAWDLIPDGTLANRRLVVDFYPGRSGDGLCVDAEGRLYVAAGLHERRGTSETLDTRPGIHVLSPDGDLLAFAGTPEDTVTNCTFGGEDRRTLYVTCGRLLLSVRTRFPVTCGRLLLSVRTRFPGPPPCPACA